MVLLNTSTAFMFLLVMDDGVVWCQPAVFWMQLSVFANHLPLIVHPMTLQYGLHMARFKKKTNLHLPKDMAAVIYQLHAFLKREKTVSTGFSS